MKKTDWDHYYQKPYKLNTFLKKVVTKRLLGYIKKYAPQETGFTIIEFGGGNSCFFEIFDRAFRPAAYYIIDNNQVGLDELKKRTGDRENLVLIHRDMMDPGLEIRGDIVFSVGLIEHFNEEDTKKAILAHLDVLKKDGVLILGFPTPTFLYRFARTCSEVLRTWIFHDERPLKIEEVLETVQQSCSVLETGIIWSIVFTQAFIIAVKR